METIARVCRTTAESLDCIAARSLTALRANLSRRSATSITCEAVDYHCTNIRAVSVTRCSWSMQDQLKYSSRSVSSTIDYNFKSERLFFNFSLFAGTRLKVHMAMSDQPNIAGSSEGRVNSTGDWLVQGKVLICMSGADHVTLKEGKEQETGFFLKELGRPLFKLLDAGYDVVFANPTGRPPKMDPLSDKSVWFATLWKELKKEKALLEKMKVEKNFDSPRRFSSLTDEELDDFSAVFLPGGHAPMADLWNDADLGRILLHFHHRNKPTGMICHAPIALLSTKQVEADKPWAYKGYKMTCYSNMEEKVNEFLWGQQLPYKVETELRKCGGELVEAPPMTPKVTADRELITAQGPTSADRFGEAFVQALNAQKAKASLKRIEETQ